MTAPRKQRLLVAAIVLTTGLVMPAHAQPARPDADWPCQQIKVPEMSIAAMWSGPTLPEGGSDWHGDLEVADLVQYLAERRVPIDQAEAAIAAFAGKAGAHRQERLATLLTGLFQTMNQQRAAVLVGLERFARRQRAFAQTLRSDADRLATLQSGGGSGAAATNQLAQQVAWEQRIFEERHRMLTYVCEVPSRIEQRLFALSRAIQQAYE